MTLPVVEYNAAAKFFHWFTAAAILCVVPLGIAMTNAQPGVTQNQLYDLHRSFGAVVLMATGMRLLWRLIARTPPLVGGLSRWQERVARGAHYVMYVLLFAVPLLGWAGTSAFRAPIFVFGLFELPPIAPQNRELSGALLEMHKLLAFALCAVFLTHITAAAHHHVVRKDATLRRMFPRLNKN
jgi:cytochrome b561